MRILKKKENIWRNSAIYKLGLCLDINGKIRVDEQLSLLRLNICSPVLFLYETLVYNNLHAFKDLTLNELRQFEF